MTTKKLSRNIRRGLTYTALTIFSAMLLLQLPACVEEQITPPPNDGKTITFSLSVPKDFNPVTYALTEPDENEVRTVDVVLFDKNDGSYISGPHRGEIAGQIVSLRSIPSTATDYVMAVFANSRDIIDGITTITTKDALLAEATLSHTGKWETNTSSGSYKHIPMYGEKTHDSTDPVSLTRMLARINVRVTQAAGTFTLQSVRFANYNTEGYVAAQGIGISIPTGNEQKTGFANALDYTSVVKSNSCLNEIYTFEATAGDPEQLSTNPCIIIGGTYNGVPDNYYRIDFANNEGDLPSYLDILRNHSYNIDIEKINGLGYESAEKAYEARPVNVQYSIVGWDDSKLAEVEYNGQYFLGVSQKTFSFDATARTELSADNTLVVVANSPLTLTASEGWLTPLPFGDVVESGFLKTYTYKLICDANATAAPLTADVTIKVGNLESVVSVSQSNIGPLPLTISDLVDYYLLDGNTKTITVNSTAPWVIKSVTEKLTNGSTGGNLLSSYGDLIVGTSGDGSSQTALTFSPVSGTPARGGVVEVVFASQTLGQYEDVTVKLPLAGMLTGNVDASQVVWAGSNIYYNGTHLTFDSVDTADGITDNEHKQGVFFQRGSLYGVAPNGSFSTSNTAIYPPFGGVTTVDALNSQGKGISSWSTIPNVTTALSASTANNFLYYRTDDVSDLNAARGDICLWLTLKGWAPGSQSGTKWRMPTTDEFGAVNTTNYSIPPNNAVTSIWTTQTISDATGQGLIYTNQGRWNTLTSLKPFYPASGSRNSSGSLNSSVGTGGRYWSGSPTSSSNGAALNFYSSTAELGSYINQNGCSVRCVVEQHSSPIEVYGIADSFLLDGNTYSFTLYTEEDFTISHSSPDIESITESGTAGVNAISFTTNVVTSGTNRDIELTITTTGGSKTVGIVGEPAHLITTFHAAVAYPVSNNQKHRLYVEGPADWIITNVQQVGAITGGGGVINISGLNGVTGVANNEKVIEFETNDDSGITSGTFEITFEAQDGTYNATTKTINFEQEYKPAPHRGWAGCNIYFDESIGENGAMTFSDVGDTSKQNYQGLFFMWGSLYGISPVGNAIGDISFTSGTNVIFYPPNDTPGLGSELEPAMTSWGQSGNIPYTTEGSSDLGNDVNYLYYRTDATTGTPQRGDICRWLTEKGYAPAGKKWRMPTRAEFFDNNYQGTTYVTTSNYISSGGAWPSNQASLVESNDTNKQGRWEVAAARSKSDSGTTAYFPAAGLRDVTGPMLHIGSEGRYWSASPYSATNAYRLYFYSTTINVGSASRWIGYSVRCVIE